jgi:hypothetical protein
MSAVWEGDCEHCAAKFSGCLIRNGFNDTAYAYCNECGMTGFMSAYREDIPPAAEFRSYGLVSAATETRLASCPCGGRFLRGASPRCPRCKQKLSPEHATRWLERQAPGTAGGWRWQRDWTNLYALVVEDRSIELEWVMRADADPRNESA